MKRRQDGHAPANRRLEADRAAAFSRQREKILPAICEERFIRRHDVFSRLQRSRHKLTRNPGSADEFDDYRDIRIVHDFRNVAGHHAGRERDASIGRRVAVANFDKIDSFTDATRYHIGFPE